LIPAFVLSAALPAAVRAQVEVRLPPIKRPRATAAVGPFSVTAELGRRGIEIRTGNRRIHPAPERAPAPRPVPRGPAPAPSASTSATASRVLATADRYVGTKYVYGGATASGFDCSGFVQFVFRRQGVQLPRTSRQQATAGTRVAGHVQALRPGDLMMFASNGSRIDHMAIYVGRNRIIHSSASGGGVGYDDLSTKRGRWFVDHHVGSRRLLADGRSLVGDVDAALRAFTALDPPDRAPVR
jgi:cell wall-associated NlpC family hydrolase